MTGVSVTVAAIYYMFTLRINMRTQELALKSQELTLKTQEQNLETRQAQLFMGIYQAQSTPEFIKQWDEVMSRSPEDVNKSYFPSPWKDASLISVMKYFEGIAVLLKKELIDVNLVYELMPTMVMSFWLKNESALKRYRVEMNFPQAGRNLEASFFTV
jgi:hypothetical protein